jgi:hypothetical protein
MLKPCIAFILKSQVDDGELVDLILENEGKVFIQMSGTTDPMMQHHIPEDQSPHLVSSSCV